MIPEEQEKSAGVICLQAIEMEGPTETQGHGMRGVEIIWGHTTPSFCVGHMAIGETEPTTFISRKDSSKSYVLGGTFRSVK